MTVNPYRPLIDDEVVELLDSMACVDHKLAHFIKGDTMAIGYSKADIIAKIVKRADELRAIRRPGERSVEDYAPASLIRRAINNASSGRPQAEQWVHVMTAFGLGSTYAAQLCRLYDFDPEAVVGQKEHEGWDYRTDEERAEDGDEPIE